MTIDFLYKDTLAGCIDLASTRRWMQMDHVRWSGPVDCWRSKIKDNIKSV